MAMRERFLDHIRNGAGRSFVSLQIGAVSMPIREAFQGKRPRRDKCE